MELVRYAESEFQAWFDANEMITPIPQEHNMEESQAICLYNTYMVDGSWISIAHFSGRGWVWMDSLGKIQLIRMQNLRRRETALHSEVEALRWAMESMLQHSSCQNFGTDCNDLITMIKESHARPSFATELETTKTLKIYFPDFKISHIPRVHNEILDFLAKSGRSFHKELCYISCYIPVWLPRPP